MSWVVAFDIGSVNAQMCGRGLPSLTRVKKRIAADMTKG